MGRKGVLKLMLVTRRALLQKKSKSHMLTMPRHTADDIGNKWTLIVTNITARTHPITLYMFWDEPCQRNTDVFREQKSPTRYNDSVAGSHCPRGGNLNFLF